MICLDCGEEVDDFAPCLCVMDTGPRRVKGCGMPVGEGAMREMVRRKLARNQSASASSALPSSHGEAPSLAPRNSRPPLRQGLP